MTEFERRKVEVYVQPRDIKGNKLTITLSGTENSFALMDSAGQLIATSLSNIALADWAFKNSQIREVLHRYNASQVGDGR